MKYSCFKNTNNNEKLRAKSREIRAFLALSPKFLALSSIQRILR